MLLTPFLTDKDSESFEKADKVVKRYIFLIALLLIPAIVWCISCYHYMPDWYSNIAQDTQAILFQRSGAILIATSVICEILLLRLKAQGTAESVWATDSELDIKNKYKYKCIFRFLYIIVICIILIGTIIWAYGDIIYSLFNGNIVDTVTSSISISGYRRDCPMQWSHIT